MCEEEERSQPVTPHTNGGMRQPQTRCRDPRNHNRSSADETLLLLTLLTGFHQAAISAGSFNTWASKGF